MGATVYMTGDSQKIASRKGRITKKDGHTNLIGGTREDHMTRGNSPRRGKSEPRNHQSNNLSAIQWSKGLKGVVVDVRVERR